VVLRYPGNIPGMIGHHWSSGIAMATPIAHKGATAGASAHAMTALDLLLKPELLAAARNYFQDQTRDTKWQSLLPEGTKPPIDLNQEKMDRFRPALRKLRYDGQVCNLHGAARHPLPDRSLTPSTWNLLEQLLHQADQVLLVERRRLVGSCIEESPQVPLLLQTIEDELLLDDGPLQRFLVEAADGPLENVGHPEILRRDHMRRGSKFDLQDSPMNVDLQQVGPHVSKGIRRVFGWIELELNPGEPPVDPADEFTADGVQLYGSVAAKGLDLLGLEQEGVVFVRERLDGFSQLLQSVFWQSRMAPSAGLV